MTTQEHLIPFRNKTFVSFVVCIMLFNKLRHKPLLKVWNLIGESTKVYTLTISLPLVPLQSLGLQGDKTSQS